MIRFACPACQTNLEVSDALATQVVACSACGRKLRVPVVSQKAVQKQRKRSTGKDVSGISTGFADFQAVLFMIVGSFASVFGCLLTFFYWLVYSTTVDSTSHPPFGGTSFESVHNVGLMNNRSVGITVGVGVALGGLLLLLGGFLGHLLVGLLGCLRNHDDSEP